MKSVYQSVLLVFFAVFGFIASAQLPVYNSYPAAQAVIFLDFDGQTINGTYWNSTGPIVCGTAGLNTSQVTEVFNRVAEDFRPFNINITTDSTRYWQAPQAKRMRVIITTSNEWYGNGAGGVSFVNSFTWGDNTPSFIFTALLGYNAKAVAEAASHEAGHTLGLRHQSSYNASCARTAEYNAGIGEGETGWAPIMGVGYYQNFTVWNLGPTPTSCSTVQNDLETIASAKNGFGYRTDDHSNTFVDATYTTFTNNQFILDGIIGKSDDVDVFKFKMSKKSIFRLNATPYHVASQNSGSNLDMQVDLLDGSQNLLNSYNPSTLLNSIVDTLLSEGTYYLRIDGTGNANTSEYGSLGSYSLQGNLIDVTPLPLRKLELKGISQKNKHNLSWIIDADEAIESQQLEYSLNGHTFQTLASLGVNDRAYQYTPTATGAIQYRLNIHFDNGKQSFSNIITLHYTDATEMPRLLSTWVSGSDLQVNSPTRFEYLITDFNGKVLLQGKGKEGRTTIGIPTLSMGGYLIRFTNGSASAVEKFIKR